MPGTLPGPRGGPAGRDIGSTEVFGGQLRLRALLKRQCGAVVRQNGSLMRAGTGCEVGSDGVRLIEVVAADGTRGRLRAGTRVAGAMGEVNVATLIAQAGGKKLNKPKFEIGAIGSDQSGQSEFSCAMNTRRRTMIGVNSGASMTYGHTPAKKMEAFA